MTPTDAMVLRKLREYRETHGKFPKCVEVTEELFKKMEFRAFVFPMVRRGGDLANPTINAEGKSETTEIKQIRVPVCLVGDFVLNKDGTIELEV